MPNFKEGPVESPGYGEEANQFSQVTEFTNDVYVYGKLYADINASDVFGDETVEIKDLVITNDLFVSGVSTFAALLDSNLGLNVSGGTGFVASTAKISDLTSGRVVYSGASGELQDSANLTFDGTELSAGLIDGGSY